MQVYSDRIFSRFLTFRFLSVSNSHFLLTIIVCLFLVVRAGEGRCKKRTIFECPVGPKIIPTAPKSRRSTPRCFINKYHKHTHATERFHCVIYTSLVNNTYLWVWKACVGFLNQVCLIQCIQSCWSVFIVFIKWS